MSIVRITSTSPTPEEKKGLELRELRREVAELALEDARIKLQVAHRLHAQARREYRKALNDLVTYREKLESSKNS